MQRIARLRNLAELKQLTLSRWTALQQCPLKGIIDNAELDGSLPDPILTRATLAGRFYHRAMELAALSQDDAELDASIEAEIELLQSEATKWPHLRRAGSVSGWDEVNSSAALAMRVSKTWRSRVGSGALSRVEHLLKSQDGMLIGKPDRYAIVGNRAFLNEYKSGAIRDDAGMVKAAFLDQLRFYAVLIFDNHDVEAVIGSVQSLSGDSFDTTLNRADAIEFSGRLSNHVEQVNLRVREGQPATNFANASSDACSFCSAQSICQRYKAEQDQLGFEGEQYVCEGIATDVNSGGGERVCRATFADELRKRPLTIALPAEVGSAIELNKKYQLLNLRRRGACLEWGYTSRILRFE